MLLGVRPRLLSYTLLCRGLRSSDVRITAVPFAINHPSTAVDAVADELSSHAMAPRGDFKQKITDSATAVPHFLPFYLYEVEVHTKWVCDTGFN